MKTMLRQLILLLCLFAIMPSKAQNKDIEFDKFFCDSTLRVDYIFSGDTQSQQISLDKCNLMPHWYGKRNNLDILPVQGNGQITVRDHNTKQVIYTNSFSTLFQEWLTYDEAKITNKSFENVFLVPMPKNVVDITVDLRDNRQKIVTTMTHVVNPNDILIRHIGFNYVTPYITLQAAEDTTKCIHIAYVAEGYSKDEMTTFLEDARIATEALFEHEPFKSKRNRFNIIAVESTSEDSGTSVPSKGVWKNTVLGSHFDTFYSNRYLTTCLLYTSPSPRD